jgi:hypothetical protein
MPFDLAPYGVTNCILHQYSNLTGGVYAHVTSTILLKPTLSTMQVSVKVNSTAMHLIPLSDRVVQHHTLGTSIVDVQVVMDFFKAVTEACILQQFTVMIALY